MKAFNLSIVMGMGLSTVAVAANLIGGESPRALIKSEQGVELIHRQQELGQIDKKTTQPTQETSVALNDPALSQAWGLQKTEAMKAWEITQGSKDIVVAIIDTGADINHEDLAQNIWTNPGESGLDKEGRNKATNGIDDDGNGYTDDIHGWNFVSNNNSLNDNHGHGTHIAGIVGAEGGNGKGIRGIAPNVSMMILKYYDPKVAVSDNLKNTILAINYAVKMNANIINYSGGGTEYSQPEKNAIEGALRKGILFIAAAGNEKNNSDKYHYYPADYGLSNIVSVTAVDPGTEVLASSNYGTETVDIAAPGQAILSTLPENKYGPMTGTSQATAFVTGAAALIMSQKKSNQFTDIKKYILSTGDQNLSLIQKTRTSRQLNLFKALAMLDGGISITGITAANTVNMKGSFNSDPNTQIKDQTAEVSTFGKSLLETLSQMQPENEARE
jgi:thermitase